jgi:hypothetical protein
MKLQGKECYNELHLVARSKYISMTSLKTTFLVWRKRKIFNNKDYYSQNFIQSRNAQSLRTQGSLYIENAVFWDVTPCGSCKNRRFGGTHHLIPEGGILNSRRFENSKS